MRLLAATIAIALTEPALAQTPPPAQACTAAPALPPEFAAWPDRTPLTAATTATTPAATLPIGKATQLSLAPTPTVRFAVRPARPAAPTTHSGLVAFTVARPGTYRVALGAGLWIDILRGGRPVASAAHGHGPPCSGIRKIVDFRLAPGQHLLQLSGGKEPSVAVMIAAVR